MKKFLVLTVVLGSVLAIACGGKPVRVEGKVTRETSGQPIAGAWVYDPTREVGSLASQDTVETLAITDLSKDPRVVKTDSSGYYVLEGISRSSHFIYFAAKDHEPLKVSFRDRGPDTLFKLDVQLEPSPIGVSY